MALVMGEFEFVRVVMKGVTEGVSGKWLQTWLLLLRNSVL